MLDRWKGNLSTGGDIPVAVNPARRFEDNYLIKHVTIIGGGFSGTLLAINLLRHDGPRVTLIERAALGRGIAYGTRQTEHLLNVRTANMSAFPDQPDHLVRWLSSHDHGFDAADFIPRRLYGGYLRDLLDTAAASSPGRLDLVAADALAVEERGDGHRVRLSDSRHVDTDAVVLALGNLPPHVPATLQPVADHPAFIRNPWSIQPALGDLSHGLSEADTLLLIGSGLTMVDVAVQLDSAGFKGRMIAISRRGLLPHRHASGGAHPARRRERPAPPLSRMLRAVRDRASDIGWRSAVDELRPFTQAIWQSADDATRARFLRHLRPWWDVHRHRLAPRVADRIACLIEAGRLEVRAGKICHAEVADKKLNVVWRARGTATTTTLDVSRIINCVGPQGDVTQVDEPLLGDMIAHGTIRPDAERLGIDVDATARVRSFDGQANESIFAVGPMTRGAFWEITAVPDIRRQVWDLARYLSNAHWVAGEGL